MSIRVNITGSLSDVIVNLDTFDDKIDKALQASSFIVERAYVKQTPVNDGDFRKNIKVEKGNLEYVVTSRTLNEKGENYPVSLYKGTGRLAGTPDQGFTTGHVRAGTVAWGAGGIRPNKVADRAKEDSEEAVIKFVNKNINRAVLKQVKI